MTDNWTALVIDGLVGVLLAVTIAYCIMLDRRLRALKADRAALESIVAEMVAATGSAERAIGVLKQAVAACDGELTDKLARGSQLRDDLGVQLADAAEMMRRLAQVPPPVAPPAPAARAAAPRTLADTVAAARSLAQRYQDRVQHRIAA